MDELILLFKQEGRKVITTWHRKTLIFQFVAKFSGSANLGNNFLLVRTISIVFMVPC